MSPKGNGFDVLSYKGFDSNGLLPAERVQKTKQIVLNAFLMFTPSHLNFGLCNHPDHVDFARNFAKKEPWIQLAKKLEAAKFHAVFIADHPGVCDMYNGGNVSTAFERKVQLPCHDPMLLVPVLASVTQHLNFGVTVSTSYTPAEMLASQFSSLDHLTGGRIGWNIVTSNSDSAARNYNLDKQEDHDRRYNKADEYMDELYDLWERQRQRPHAAASPQSTPVLFQAGMSSAGRNFAVKHAETVFVAGPSPPVVRQTVDALRKAADRHISVVSTLLVVVKETQSEAELYYDTLRDLTDKEAALVFCSQMFGADLKNYPPGTDLRTVGHAALARVVGLWASQSGTNDCLWDTDRVAKEYTLWGSVVVGDAKTVADKIEDWVEVGDVDGFNLSNAVIPGTYDDIIQYLIPELQARGRFHKEYPKGCSTFREVLYQSPGNAHLRPDHYGAKYVKQK